MDFVRIIFAVGISLGTLTVFDAVESEIRRYASFDDFLNDLKATADDMIDYVTKIQALFCPDQPICGADGELDREGFFGELPPEVTIGNLTIKPGNVHSVVGICCLPCSCSDTCWQDNNCCPVKQLTRHKNYTDLVRKRCVAASVRSYDARPSISHYHTEFMYLMITECLPNTTDITLIEKCRNPGTESNTDVIPVTSRETGNTYWNRACAVCNNDDDDIMEWMSHCLFKNNIAYFLDSSISSWILPDTVEEVFALLSNHRQGDIIYEAPVPMYNSMCLMEEFVTDSFCKIPSTEVASETTDWLYESCRHFYSPIIKNMPQSTGQPFYRNIFCLICVQKIKLTEIKTACKREYTSTDKISAGYITALVNYKTTPHKTDPKKAVSPLVENICRCNAMFDPYLKICRPSYCPAGEVLVGCTCIQVMQNLSGMPILFHINVTAKLGQMESLNENQIKRLKNALGKTLRTIATHISVEMPLIFQQANATNPKFIFTVIVRSEPGYDTKLTLNPFKIYLDTDEAFKVRTTDFDFGARLTSKILLRKELIILNNITERKYHAQNVERLATEFIQIYSDAKAAKLLLLEPGNCQKFSRLLYCTQLQLNESEYFETTPGMITVNVTDLTFSVTDFFKIQSSNVRVCADDYLKMLQKTSGDATRNNTPRLLIVFILIMLGVKTVI